MTARQLINEYVKRGERVEMIRIIESANNTPCFYRGNFSVNGKPTWTKGLANYLDFGVKSFHIAEHALHIVINEK